MKNACSIDKKVSLSENDPHRINKIVSTSILLLGLSSFDDTYTHVRYFCVSAVYLAVGDLRFYQTLYYSLVRGSASVGIQSSSDSLTCHNDFKYNFKSNFTYVQFHCVFRFLLSCKRWLRKYAIKRVRQSSWQTYIAIHVSPVQNSSHGTLNFSLVLSSFEENAKHSIDSRIAHDAGAVPVCT